jgi:hypothetical protein
MRTFTCRSTFLYDITTACVLHVSHISLSSEKTEKANGLQSIKIDRRWDNLSDCGLWGMVSIGYLSPWPQPFPNSLSVSLAVWKWEVKTVVEGWRSIPDLSDWCSIQ